MKTVQYLESVARVLGGPAPLAWVFRHDGSMVIVSANGQKKEYTSAQVDTAEHGLAIDDLRLTKETPEVIALPASPVLVSPQRGTAKVRKGKRG